MEPQNLTSVLEFILLGLSDDPDLQPVLFVVFLFIYLITVLGNLLIIKAVTSDFHLHTPMYFFLCNLSLADIGFSSTTIPKMLANLQTQSKSISYAGCLMQVALFALFGSFDSLLLTVMAYDRLVAICHPLRYLIIMNPRLCGILVLLSLSISLLNSLAHCLMVSQFNFYAVTEIPNFFCDPPRLLKLACDYTSTTDIFIFFHALVFGGLQVSGILYSYVRIVSSILRVPSASGKYKAFSTCGSHLSIVCLFYGTAIGVYCSSVLSVAPRKVVVFSMMYTMVTPMLNPFIYSLRNRDIKTALQRLVKMTA
ncbi:PREDICTED: olfactory receptor 7E24-like [Dipodomys ordii]|uniref:Olfactory receptor 7E24-like n=1 Tax=Dipodomys ordii TaxID=10020 RepID=A0A1S3GSX2_DIPOR|nr:PREDICTED: olfactory receptor 7E24-like [Dipodomys ordii]